MDINAVIMFEDGVVATFQLEIIIDKKTKEQNILRI